MYKFVTVLILYMEICLDLYDLKRSRPVNMLALLILYNLVHINII